MTFNLKKVLREMCMSSFEGGMVPGAGNEVGFLTCVTDKTLKHTQQRVCHIFIHLPGIPWDLDLSQRCLSFRLSCCTALTPERASSETKPIRGPSTTCHSCRNERLFCCPDSASIKAQCVCLDFSELLLL